MVDTPPETVRRPALQRRWLRRMLIGVGAALLALTVLYLVDLAVSSGRIPRGVTVAGVDVGSEKPAEAEALLRSRLGDRNTTPIEVRTGDVTTPVLPADAGLSVDLPATLERVGHQPHSPWTRLTSFFTTRTVDVVSAVDQAKLTATAASIATRADRPVVEGAITFTDGEPVATPPVTGRSVAPDAVSRALSQQWVSTSPVVVEVDERPTAVDAAAVDAALTEVARPAVSAPVAITGENGARATLEPADIAATLTFAPDGGKLVPRFDVDALTRTLAPQLAATERKPKNATFDFASGTPVVVPSVDGYTVQWPQTLAGLPTAVASTTARTLAAQYAATPPAVTTDRAKSLGIREVIGEYTTGGFERASGINIGLTARIVDGAVVLPGETFSLNEYTGPRGLDQGFVESGIINNGRPSRAVGGGISQFATTLYNAGYFGGMEDVEHTEHSYYISRYPAAREATVFEGAIDLKFRNPATTGVVIESFADESSVTVRLWGTKTVTVQSIPGERTNPTTPNRITLPKGPGCSPSAGAGGFTTSDTRVITSIATGAEISRTTRTVKYDPVPIVKCE